ncbi:MAG TPA: argininosuccinate lyase [Thermoplasmata archaeon]|nr:argininosuccinate lyase [Thermoplasmata archaeon]
MKKVWSGRIKVPSTKEVEDFTSSIRIDKRLYKHDIIGSIAHTKMLGKTNIISSEESREITEGLKQIYREIKEGELQPSKELEDIHMNIEARLIEKIGKVGEKLPTARSRNDQIALDERLWLREEIAILSNLLVNLQEALIEKAKKNIHLIMPGFTHSQHAEPVLFSHWLLAHFYKIQRDFDRLQDCFKRVNISPLGCVALAGSSLPIDRKLTSALLGFEKPCENSMDGVSDRDFLVESICCASLIMLHLSQLSEELIEWSTPEFGFIEIGDKFTTGSSLMPQKRNPDVAELIRGKTAITYGSLVGGLTLMKGLPLTYNKDLQEDKSLLFQALDQTRECLSILPEMIDSIKAKGERMKEAAADGFCGATELANYLVTKGVPFREAHGCVSKLVARLIDQGRDLSQIKIEELKQLSPKIQIDIKEVKGILSIENLVKTKSSYGGSSPFRVEESIGEVKQRVRDNREITEGKIESFKKLEEEIKDTQ